MRAPARRPLVRSGPGVSAWTALPERDRQLLLWLIGGDVVTAELAALLAYGHRRVAQRRLARLVDYGLLSGFWAANRQRPRGRHAYSLAKPARVQLEQLVWPRGRPGLLGGGIETVSPVIHQLATHDLMAAFLAASDPTSEAGLVGWVPERPLVRLTSTGTLRPDALAVVRSGERLVALFIERDLGTERGGVLIDKVTHYDRLYGREVVAHPLHVGFVVESYRRAHAVRRALARAAGETRLGVWVTTEADLRADPYGCLWVSPEIDPVATVDLAPNELVEPEEWPFIGPGCLTVPDALEAFDGRLLDEIEPVSFYHAFS